TASCRAAGIPKELGRLAVVLTGLDLVDFFLEMAVDTEQVQPAIQIVIKKENAKFQEEPAGRTNAFSDRGVEEIRRRVLRDIQRGHFVREITDGDPELVVVAEVRRV